MNRRKKFALNKSFTLWKCSALLLFAFVFLALGSLIQHEHLFSFALPGVGLALFLPGTPGLLNYGRFSDQITGINGVNAGGQCNINLPTNQRYHRITINTTDAGSAAAVGTIITNVQLVVSGIVVRDLTPTQIIKIAQANGYRPKLGELPIFFSEPWTNINEPSDITSWDMSDQGSFQIRLALAGGTTPGITGTYVYDYQRNGYIDNSGKFVPKLQIIGQKAFNFATAAAQNVITSPSIPINYPIRRIWMDVAAGTITAIQIKQDGNIVTNFSSFAQMNQCYREMGFIFAQVDWMQAQNVTGPAALIPLTTIETPAYFAGAAIFDEDQRLWKSLKVAQTLTALITTSNATNLTMVMETVPGAYA